MITSITGEYPLYMRLPGEKPPAPGYGPRRDTQAEGWELAA
jgi:hypothetical protein